MTREEKINQLTYYIEADVDSAPFQRDTIRRYLAEMADWVEENRHTPVEENEKKTVGKTDNRNKNFNDMKIATDLEQSQRLARILPFKSADMYWDYDIQKHEDYLMVMDEQFDDTCIPAWSLSTLFSILPNEIIFELKSYRFKMRTDVYSSGEKYYDLGYQGNGYWLEYEDSTELVDACVNLIIKLHEKDLLFNVN